MILKLLKQMLENDDLSLVYSGIFSDSMTERIIDLSSVYFEQNSELTKMRKRTSFLVAESFQNVVRHGKTSDQSESAFLSSGSFLVRFRNEKCFIASRNKVPLSNADEIRQKIKDINSKGKHELKAIYKEILTQGSISEKGGAGLGLIEMARKTQNKLHYCFERIDDVHCDFYLMLILDKEEEDDSAKTFTSELNSNIAIFKRKEELNHFLLFQGDFANLLIDPVSEMIKSSMDSISNNISTRMKLHHGAIEMLKNIHYYSYFKNDKKMGMIAVGMQNDAPVISAHYYIRRTSRSKMEKILESFKIANKAELDQHYRKKLRINSKSNNQNTWIGLIELARISKSWEYEIEDLDKDVCNLGFQVSV